MSACFRLLSANLANGKADHGAFGALVEAVEADVVAVQELGPRQAETLARLLPFGKLEPAHDHKGMGVALRNPGSVQYLPLPYRGAYVAELDLAGPGAAVESIEVVNVHLAAPHMPPLVQALRNRRGQLAGLVAYLDGAPGRRRAVVGDLNATPRWPAYRRLAARFRDAAEDVAREVGRPAERTWGPWPGARRLLRIDHVLVSGLVPLQVLVLPIAGSDHWALVADLSAP